jgi:hypothetical protein
MNNLIKLSIQSAETEGSWIPRRQRREGDHMVSVVFTGTVTENPYLRTTEHDNTIATFPIHVKQTPHLPPTRIVVSLLAT